MAQYSPIEINYNPVSTYPGTQQNNFVGPQSSPTIFSSGTMALYLVQNGAGDQTGNPAANNDLTINGTVPFIQSPTPAIGSYCAGTFSDSNYFTTPTGLNTAFQSLGTFTIEMWVYVTSLSGTQTIWSTQIANSSIQIQPTGRAVWGNEGGSHLFTPISSIPVNTWINIACTWDGCGV
jgi:hypothetical protein